MNDACSFQSRLNYNKKKRALLYSPMVVRFNWANLDVLDMRHKQFFSGSGPSASGYLHRMVSTKSRVTSSNVITAAATCIPDTYRVLSGKISGKEYGIRMTERGAGIGGSSAGTYVGVVVGSCICPGVGSVIGGFIGNILGGIGGRKIASKCLR